MYISDKNRHRKSTGNSFEPGLSIACALSENTQQSADPRILSRTSSIHLNKAFISVTHKMQSKDFDQPAQMTDMWEKLSPSRKHAYIVLTPLNPTFI